MIAVALGMVLLAADHREASANENGPILGFTGAPGELGGDGANCTFPGGCHQSFVVDSGPGSITIEVPASYEPGMTYAITVDVAQESQLRWGFQLTVLDEEDGQAGTLAPSDATTKIQIFIPREYVTHDVAGGGTAAGQPAGNSWTFDWTAPETDVGPVTFYAAGNAANNNGANTGDYIYTTTATVPAPEPGSLAAGLLALATAAALSRGKGRPRSKD